MDEKTQPDAQSELVSNHLISSSAERHYNPHPSDTISRWMPIEAVIERLVNHGCPNISSDLDTARCDQDPCFGGGFGDVYRGKLLNGTKVALKCVRLYVDKSKDYRKEFKHAARELHTWSKCQHPNVVYLLGLAEFRGKIAMVSPWMEKGSVSSLDSSDDRIDRCQLCVGVARGLAYLHATNIVHGDLKGGNVLLSNNGEAQLVDFGNAVLAGSSLLFTKSTNTRSGLSMRWAAPEILQNEAPYSRQADIYALGMTMLEIISRELPYTGRNDPAVMMAVLSRRHPKRPEDTIPKDSKQGDTLWSLLKTCWSWDPKERPEAPYVVSAIETIRSEDLLVEPPETSAMSPSPRSPPGSNTSETKKRPETPEGVLAIQRKRPRLERDQPAQIPIAHQHLISKATETLNYVSSQKDALTEHAPELKYSIDDLTDLLYEAHKLGVDAPETAQLELLSSRVCGFQQKTRPLLLELDSYRGLDDAASLVKLEELVAVGKGLRLPLDDEFAKLEPLVTRLQFLRDLQTTNVNRLTLDQAEAFFLRGQHAGVPPTHQAMIELTRVATSGLQWMNSAASILTQPQPDMRDLDRLLPVAANSIPTLPYMLGKLTQVRSRGREYEKKVEACLRPPKGTLVRIDDAIKVATAALDEVFFPAAKELLALLDEARTWEKTCEDIMSGGFNARGNTKVLDEVRAMRDQGKSKFGAFQMPWFEEVMRQLAVHDDWVSQLPWTRSGLSASDLDSIVRDMTGDRDAECVPPNNEECTCVCLEPVVVDESAQVVQCDHCLVRFHIKCVEGSCPFCDDRTWDKLMGEPRTFKLWYETAGALSRYYSPDYRALRAIVLFNGGGSALTEPIINLIKQLGKQESPDPATVPQIRHFMRKLYRIRLEISARPEVFAYGLSLAHLHRQMTLQPRTKHMARQKPKFVFDFEMDLLPEFPCPLCDDYGCDSDSDSDFNSDLQDGWYHLSTRCSKCQSRYHKRCIALSNTDRVPEPFVCPLCLLKSGESYGPAEVRVMYHDDDPEENAKYVDVKACLDNYSWRVIRRALPPPVRPTITVKLFLFIPGTNSTVEEPESHPQPHSEASAESTLSQHTDERLPSGEWFGSACEFN